MLSSIFLEIIFNSLSSNYLLLIYEEDNLYMMHLYPDNVLNSFVNYIHFHVAFSAFLHESVYFLHRHIIQFYFFCCNMHAIQFLFHVFMQPARSSRTILNRNNETIYPGSISNLRGETLQCNIKYNGSDWLFRDFIDALYCVEEISFPIQFSESIINGCFFVLIEITLFLLYSANWYTYIPIDFLKSELTK